MVNFPKYYVYCGIIAAHNYYKYLFFYFKTNNKMEQNQVQVSVSQILLDLNNGLDRKAIKEKYNLNGSQLKTLFSHPKLKGKKVKKAEVQLVIIDDTADTREVSVSPEPMVLETQEV